MRIAFIVGQFPTISETFILNQITGLMERGHEVDIYSLQGRPAETKMHPSIEEYHLLPFTYYVPSIPKNYFWRGLKGLGLLIGHGFKAPRVCWRALNVFRFGKKAASLNLLYTAIPALGQKPYDIIHCQFGIYALDGLALKQIGALQES